MIPCNCIYLQFLRNNNFILTCYKIKISIHFLTKRTSLYALHLIFLLGWVILLISVYGVKLYRKCNLRYFINVKSSVTVSIKKQDSCVVYQFQLLGNPQSASATIFFLPGIYYISILYSSSIIFYLNNFSILKFLVVRFLWYVYIFNNLPKNIS